MLYSSLKLWHACKRERERGLGSPLQTFSGGAYSEFVYQRVLILMLTVTWVVMVEAGNNVLCLSLLALIAHTVMREVGHCDSLADFHILQLMCVYVVWFSPEWSYKKNEKL